MKQTFRKLLIAMLVFCTFVGVLPMIAAEDFTAQAAAATVYYDFKKGHPGSVPTGGVSGYRQAFSSLSYDVVAGRNTGITSGQWAYNGYTTSGTSSENNYASYVSTASTHLGILMVTSNRDNVAKASVKFKGLNSGKYIPYLNINGANYPSYSGIITARIYPAGSSTAMYTKEIFLASYPDADNYIPLGDKAQSFGTGEYVLEIEINKVRTYAMLNGLQLVAADSNVAVSINPTNDLGVYEVKVGETINIPFTQRLSDGTTSTSAISGWQTPVVSASGYVTTSVSSSSRNFQITGVKATSTPVTITYQLGAYAKAKVNVIVRAANYSPTQTDVFYDFQKPLPEQVSAEHIHVIGKHVTYGNTAVGGYGEVNKYTGTASDSSVNSAPWKISSIASTLDFSPIFHGYGIQSKRYGIADVKIRVPVGGTYMPQLVLHSPGIQTATTISIINESGTTISTVTIPAGTSSETVNLASHGLSFSAQEYTIRFNKSATGSTADAGANYYNGIKLVKTSVTTVTFNANGGTNGSRTQVTATYGFPMPSTSGEGMLPTRTGYRFGGYYDGKNGVVGSGTQYYTKDGTSNHSWDKTASAATLYASWNVNTYYLVFNKNNGSGTMSDQAINYDVTANITANAFTRTGYTFNGWNTKADGTGTAYANKASVKNLSTTNQAKINLYAQWTPITYSVKYNANGGSGTMSNSSHTYGTAKALTANAFTKTGYTFNGWNTKADGSGTAYANSASVSNLTATAGGTVNLYAQWKANTYTVKYNANGGSGSMSNVTHTYDTAKTLTANAFTKAGYTFQGWDTSSSGTTVVYANKASVTNLAASGTVNLYAVWKANSYKVTYDGNGGTPSAESKNVTYNSTYGTLASASRTGYTFAGWYTAASGGTKITSSTTVTITAAQTLYAHWTANKYTVTFDMASGTGGTESTSATYGSAMPKVTPPTREGFTFLGYFGTAGGSVQYYNADGTSAKAWDKAEDATLYARWSRNTYTVTLNANGGTAGTTSVTASYGSAMPEIATLPTRAGYTFAGYYNATSGGTKYYNDDGSSARNWNIAGNTTLYARWTPNTYTVTLNNMGATTAGTESTTATYNSAMPAITVPTKTGYTFTGYYSNSSGGTQYYKADGTSAKSWDKTSDGTLYAQWTANKYAVTFNNQGATTAGTASTTATYNSAMPAITVPTKTGYTFGGYYIDAACTGTQYYNADGSSARNWTRTVDTTLYAKWTPNTYTVKFNANTGSGTMSDQVFTYDVAQNLTANTFTREGYTFAGWSLNSVKYTDGQSVSNLATSGSVTLYATWTPNTYTVTLSEGGTVTATYNSAMPAIEIPKKAGKVFAGYFDSEGVKYYKTDGTSAKNWDKASDATLIAHWDDATVTLTDPGAKSIKAGSTIKFTLSGSTDSGMDITYSSNNLPEGATLDASTGGFSWKTEFAHIGDHTITFTATDGDVSASVTVTITVTRPQTIVTLSGGGTITATYGLEMPTITPPVKEGFVFDGYYKEENGVGTKYYNADGTSAGVWNRGVAEVTIYANWIPGEVTITPIEDKIVEVEEELTFTVEATSTAPGDITYTAENLPEGATFDSATGEFSWTPTVEQVGEYTIIFKGSDGVNYAEVTVTVVVNEIRSAVSFDEDTEGFEAVYSQALPNVTVPKKDGWIFDGYYDGENGTGTKYYNADGTPTRVWDKKDAEVTLYAKWLSSAACFGENIGAIRDILRQDEQGNNYYSVYLLAGIDSREYNAVGFEVTVRGQTIMTEPIKTVYQSVTDSTKRKYPASAFGSNCKHIIAYEVRFNTSFKDDTLIFRPYAVKRDGTTAYGKTATMKGIYTK